MAVDPREFQKNRDAERASAAPLGGSSADRLQRLQIGLAGIIAVVLMIGLADVVITRAQIAEDMTVPDAAPTVEPTETAAPRDPLSDVGVVPEVPAEQVEGNAESPRPEPTEDMPPANAQLQ